MFKQGHINNGEHHWTKEGQDMIEKVVRKAFGEDLTYLPAHHVSFKLGEELYEIASIETFLFNHTIAEKLWGADYLSVLQKLVVVPEEDRLAWVIRNI